MRGSAADVATASNCVVVFKSSDTRVFRCQALALDTADCFATPIFDQAACAIYRHYMLLHRLALRNLRAAPTRLPAPH